MTVNIEISENLSALRDGELSGKAAESMLMRLHGDQNLQREWKTYHLIGDLLKHNLDAPDASGIMARVSESLKDDPAMIAIPKAVPRVSNHTEKNLQSFRRGGWVMPAFGAAIAASLVAVMLVMPEFTQDPLDLNHSMASNTPSLIKFEDIKPVALSEIASLPATGRAQFETISVSGARWKNLVKGSPLERKLNGYLVDHGEFGSLIGVASYTTFVSYDEKP